MIAATGATIKFDNYTDKTSSAEILRKDEAIYSPAAAPGELSQNEVGEFNKLGSECTSDEERRGIVDFGEQSRAEQGWEEPLPAADLSASKLSTENVKRELLSKGIVALWLGPWYISPGLLIIFNLSEEMEGPHCFSART